MHPRALTRESMHPQINANTNLSYRSFLLFVRVYGVFLYLCVRRFLLSLRVCVCVRAPFLALRACARDVTGVLARSLERSSATYFA
jgi:hypothetical protein